MELSGIEFTENVSLAYIQIGELIKRLETAKDGTTDCLIVEDKDVEYIKQWTADHKEDLKPFRQARYQIKQKKSTKLQKKKQDRSSKSSYTVQQKVSEEQAKLRLQQQKEIEEATMLQQKREVDRYMKKLDFEKQIGGSQAEHAGGGNHATSTQSVKLQKYTITPFSGDFKDWLRLTSGTNLQWRWMVLQYQK